MRGFARPEAYHLWVKARVASVDAAAASDAAEAKIGTMRRAEHVSSLQEQLAGWHEIETLLAKATQAANRAAQAWGLAVEDERLTQAQSASQQQEGTIS